MPEILVPDPFSAVFLFCFVVGLVFVVLSALAGLSHDLVHLPDLSHGHGDAGVGHDVGGHHVGNAGHADGADLAHAGAGSHGAHAASHPGSSHPTSSASPLNLMTVMAFLTWFGGAGYILYTVYGIFLPLSLLVARAAGTLAGWLVYLFLVRVVLPGTLAGDLRGQTLVGTLGRVTIPIQPGRVGEIVYTLEGARHSDGARSVDDLPIERDKEVVIVRFERGIALVQEWERFRDGLEGYDTPRERALAGRDGQPSAAEADSEKD
jgi:hypothetical protein